MAFQFSDLSILIVDDDPSIREITAAVLKKLELKRVDTASDGEEAFKLFCKHNHSVVLTDWQMEPMDGLELIYKIRGENTGSPNREVPIILASGYGNNEVVQNARDSGVTELLVKPYSADNLMKMLVYVLNRPRKYVQQGKYYGPDRRRREDTAGYDGPDRRTGDRADD